MNNNNNNRGRRNNDRRRRGRNGAQNIGAQHGNLQNNEHQEPGQQELNKYRLGFKIFQEWLTFDAEKLLHTLNAERAFQAMLESKEVKEEWMPIIIKILSIAVDSKLSRQLLQNFLKTLTQSLFFRANVGKFIVKLLTSSNVVNVEESKLCIKNLLVIFRTMFKTMPNACDNILPVIINIDCLSKERKGELLMCDESRCLLMELNEIKDEVHVNLKQEYNKSSADNVFDMGPPPNDFWTISIFPTALDINPENDIYLRQNKIKGGYENVDHYLDVQFRLMREDFVAPLREGVKMFQEQLYLRKPRHLNNLHVYTNVKILFPVCTANKGLTYRIRFDIEKLKHVRWEVSRRLIFGSLVCLSQDNFKTILFATVSDRDTKLIKKGELELKFEQGVDQNKVSEISADQTFLMAETSAYFEAYRHVLVGLQEMRNENFPFERYIVLANNNILPPRYLQRNVVENGIFDLRPVVDAKSVLKNQDFSDTDEDLGSSDDDIFLGAHITKDKTKYSDTAENVAKAVKILNSPSWPDAATLHLDPSQYRALKAALSREFSIIQGPPGTGKTYIGLKVVKALLHNSNSWCRDPVTTDVEPRPILLVCYTNHALDQFLEGVSKFLNNGIVRVGGRSQCKALEPFLLKNLRNNSRSLRKVPVEIFRGRIQARSELDGLEAEINNIREQLEATQRGVIHEDTLSVSIDNNHIESLQFGYFVYQAQKDVNGWSTVNSKQSMIIEWLGLENMMEEDNNKIEHGFDQLKLEDEDDLAIDDEVQHEIENRRLDLEDDSKEKTKNSKKELNINKYLAMNIENLDNDVDMINKFIPVKISKRKLRQRLKLLLHGGAAMTSNEANAINDVWALATEDRWKLYRYWVNLYQNYLKLKVSNLEVQYQKTFNIVEEMLQLEDLNIMRKAKVIGMTTTAAAKYRSVLGELRSKILVVEEAAEVLESHVVTTIPNSCDHIILIGDHKQLRPSPNVYKLAKKYNLEISLFERMVNNNVPCETLQEQHRMRPQISNLMLNIYPELKDHNSVLMYESIKGVQSNIFFITHNFLEESDTEIKSKSNDHEAKYVAALCKYLMLQGYKPDQITILTPYTGQLIKLKKYMPKEKYEGVRVTAVDNFQGEENEIILLSLVRSNNEGKIGFLGEDNRVCVALSRAKKGFYIIGNIDFLAKYSALWKKIKISLEKVNCVGPALQLCCQNHSSDPGIRASKSEDFLNAPEGGCQKPCEARLVCGHACTLACHAYDKEHKIYKCQKTCNRIICDFGHFCKKKCFLECGNCTVLQPKKLPKCGHTQDVPCSQTPSSFICLARPCNYKLNCGHYCSNACGENHTKQCKTIVPYYFPECNHTEKVECYEKLNNPSCKTKCLDILDCEHKCNGNCSTCFQGFIHEACSNKCSRILVCGHECLSPCAKNCPPCERKCQNRCIHSRCLSRCGLPCNPCREPCGWSCPHYKCSRLCYEPCDRPRCNRKCEQRLKCGHPCIGLCGESCPDKCRYCDREHVQEIFFGTEDDPNACFVQLEDCRHIFEVTGLDQWMDQENSEITMKKCPKCNVVIRRNLRYGKVIKKILNDIETVKKQFVGEAKAIKENIVIVLENIENLNADIADCSLLGISEFNIERIKSILKECKIITEVNGYNYIVLFLSRLCKIWKGLSKDKSLQDSKDGIELKDKIKRLCQWLLNLPKLTHQQIVETDREIMKFFLMQRYLQTNKELKNNKNNLSNKLLLCIEKVENYLFSKKPLRNAEVLIAEVEKLMKEIERLFPKSSLGVSEEEKKMIIRAMDLKQGHWFKCPNGHVYCIGECGGAMEEAKCPECGAGIGGTSHHLRDDNLVAGEMDGARFSAWSEQANMIANFRFDD
ncbi:NFX1-type zinc finger-containing protein 1 isoform X1 [Hydra vulgaris]|uniref:NFX1-type zinc finger-containing protein 1 isoform X1 n=1 Tax=Hydra vulgaris TaxID=6087 RepID=UPI001F5EE329|nr:NFX1-type zinc finger-containing protein 1 isoform X1 [Hydra vulgaris]